MKFWGIFRFEFNYQIRRAWPWLMLVVLLVVSFLVARDASVADALYEDFYANGPFSIAKTTVVGSLVWLLVAAAIAGEAGARDVATGMYPLTYTAPVSKAEYLGGRFLAVLVLNALILLAVPAGIMLGVYSPGVDAKVIGPFRAEAYLTSYAFIALPNAFAATAIQFSLATRSGRAMAAYLGSVLLVFMGFFVAGLLLFKRSLGTLLDPIGIRFIVEDLSHDWTTIERNVRLVGLEGAILTNRVLWVGVALATLAVTYARFTFSHRTESTWKWRRKVGSVHFAVAIPWGKTSAIAWDSFRTIATSWAGIGMLIGLPLLTVLVVVDQMESLGTPLTPTTPRVIAELVGPLSAELSRWVIIPPLIIYFAGALIWRERDAGIAEITDTMPGSDWTPFVGKFLGLSLVLAVFMALLAAAGMSAQGILGYQHFEILLYVKILFGLQLPEYLLFAVLALTVHVAANQKYVGHLIAIMVYVFIAALATMLGIEHNMLVYGAGPTWSYTSMRGFGASLAPWAWFKLYWAAWALLLAVVARLLWIRGKESGFSVRMHLARLRLTGTTTRIAAAAVGLILTLGGFVFYNTNVLNEYRSTSSINEQRAEYERRYRRFASVPQPQLTGTNLRVELYPERRTAEIRGSYRLVNSSTRPVDSIHVTTATSGVETRGVTFDRPAKLAVNDEELGYRIYALEKPLDVGDSLRLGFEVRVEPHGFTNRGVNPSLAAKGSYFTNRVWFPFVGYQRQRELVSAADRREYGLEPRPVIASLYDVEGREPPARGGGIAFDAVVGTDGDQVAVTPGALRKTWSEGGRRYFHYSTDAPIGEEWSFFSANYAVHEGRSNDVAVRIYHAPKHTAHLDRTMRSVRASLDYYIKQFGPYPYRHLTVVEQPGAPGVSLHAEASIISHGENFPFWTPKSEPGSFDMPYAVVAHEMAHQWTLPYALVEGLPFLSEGLAWYSAMQVVKESRGNEQLQRLMSFMRQPYPFRPIRRGEPLLRALDPYLAYRRGPFAMYAMSEYVGTDRVNGALRHLIEKHDSPAAPLATTLDLYHELQAVTPDSLKYLLHDLFEVNTYWSFETERVSAVQTKEGAWQVTLDVRARKTVYDSTGVETELQMDEWVPLGVFGAAQRGHTELSAPLYLRMHRIHSGRQTITVTVPRKPELAGIDPFHLLDWMEEGDDDNIDVVAMKNPEASNGP